MTYFSSDEDRVEDKYNRHSTTFRRFAKDKIVNFRLAKVHEFAEQTKWADAIYLAGGFATSLMVKGLALTKSLDKLFEGKIVGGTSAGANCLARYYYGNEIKKIEEGLGILNIKTYCHYKPENRKTVEKLASHKEKLPLLVLPNYKWVIMYK
jgi:peptidase E